MKKSILIILTLIVGISLNAKAEDFSAVYNGDTIYYNITSANYPYTVAVTFKGISFFVDINEYSGDVSIPDSVLRNGNYYKVTSIGENAFRRCKNLTTITISSSVTSIGLSAFHTCTGLTSIIIPSSVTSINNNAFYECSGLTSINIPSSVSSIGISAFEGCRNLNTITIPSSVTSINNRTFYNCIGLTSVVIPPSVISIGEDAFYNCYSLTSVVIPSSVTSIGQGAFQKCKLLDSVVIPSSVISIGENAFNGCIGLTSITIPSSITSIGISVFEGCIGLTSIVIPSSVILIDNNAFKECIGLTSISLSSNLTSIGVNAFFHCTGLTSIVIPSSVTSIGSGAFRLSSSINTVFFNAINCNTFGSGNFQPFYGCTSLNAVIIGDSVVSIPGNAFYGFTGLTSIAIPSSITSIGNNAFSSCTSLDTVFFNAVNCSPVGTSTLHPFYGCTSLNTVIIGDGVASIPGNAFYGFTGLTKITIPSSVTSIGNNAFSACTSLDTVFFNAINCNSMGSSTSPVFAGCNNFKTLVIGGGVQSIPSYAFYNSNTLTSIISKSINPPSVQSVSFQGVNKSIPFYIPCLSKSAYQSAANLSAFTNFIDITAPTFISDTICQGETYNSHGFNFIANTSGLYLHNIQTINGCDSVINLNLTVNPSYSDTIFAKIFVGQTYTQFGFNENTNGFYTQNLQTTIGCDSIVNLSLSFEPIYVDTVSASICEGQTYTLYGFNEDSIGFYTQSLITSEGFDSIIYLNLMVNPIYNDTVSAEICNGETYNQFGFNESEPGLYTQSLQTTKGCDSIINLSLTLNPTYRDTIYAEICNGETYNQFGFNGDSTGLYAQNFQTTNGCDSILFLNLIVNYVPSPLYLSLHNAANYIELNWAGHEPLYIIYRDNDSLAMVTANIYKDSSVVEGRSYCYKLKALNGECESAFGIQECYTYTLLNDVVNNRITTKLYPNPADNKAILEVDGLTSVATVIIYDIYSRAIKTYRINQSKKELEIDVRGLAKGIYTIKIISQNINQTQKLIVK